MSNIIWVLRKNSYVNSLKKSMANNEANIGITSKDKKIIKSKTKQNIGLTFFVVSLFFYYSYIN